MKKLIILTTIVFLCLNTYCQRLDILPTSDFSTNFCRFPFAWDITKGKDINIGIVSYNEISDTTKWIKKIQLLSPESTIQNYSMSDFLNKELIGKNIQVLYISNEIIDKDYEKFINALEEYKNTSIILPAYFGLMESEKDYYGWRELVIKASEKGCIITGAHGDMYQLGDISYWKSIPIDIFAVMGREIDGFKAMMPEYKIQKRLDNSAYLTVGAVALLKSKYPQYTNTQLKNHLKNNGRKVYWSLIKIPEGKEAIKLLIPHFKENYLGKYEDDQVIKLKRNVYSASCLDLALLFGISVEDYGGWCMDVLNIEESHKLSTGNNITVAILDHTFNKNHEALKNRVVSPISFIDGIPALSDKSDHGTSMAENLVMTAPDVKIMPIVMAGENHWGDVELFIKAINYAVENGADIISCSQRAIKGDQKALDIAIENATYKGVTFVYINYSGEKEEVIIPGIIEMDKYNKKNERIYIVGTNFIDNESSITWGVSNSAPIVSGIIALLKEVKPELSPKEIKLILMESTKKSIDEIPVLDSYISLKNTLKQ